MFEFVSESYRRCPTGLCVRSLRFTLILAFLLRLLLTCGQTPVSFIFRGIVLFSLLIVDSFCFVSVRWCQFPFFHCLKCVLREVRRVSPSVPESHGFVLGMTLFLPNAGLLTRAPRKAILVCLLEFRISFFARVDRANRWGAVVPIPVF